MKTTLSDVAIGSVPQKEEEGSLACKLGGRRRVMLEQTWGGQP